MKPYVMRCPDCRTRNRIPAEKLGQTARCGKCKKALATAELLSAGAVMITDGNFEEKILRSPLPAIMFCWAPWCPSCSQVSPVMDAFAAEARGRIRVGKLNVDGNPVTASRFDVRSVPFLYIFDNGRLVESLPADMGKHGLMMKMAHYL